MTKALNDEIRLSDFVDHVYHGRLLKTSGPRHLKLPKSITWKAFWNEYAVQTEKYKHESDLTVVGKITNALYKRFWTPAAARAKAKATAKEKEGPEQNKAA